MTPGEPVSTTIGEARTDLDVLNVDRETFVERITDTLPATPANYETIMDVNAGGRAPEDEETAVELAIGPSNCAATGD